MVKFKEIQFLLKGKVIFSAKDITLPDAIKLGVKYNPINTFGIVISCFNY